MTDPTNDLEQVLQDGVDKLKAELGIEDTPVDIQAILGVAGVAAWAVVRPAAPLTTYLLGYAAGIAAANGVGAETAATHALAQARQLSGELTNQRDRR